jgi:2OG-Fe(II) oxygenase superfamily
MNTIEGEIEVQLAHAQPPAALGCLGDDLRACAQLEQAARIYSELLQHAPGHHKAERLAAWLRGRRPELARAQSGLQPAPFACVPDLLPRAQRDAAFDALATRREAFEAAATTLGVRRDGRSALSLPGAAGALGEQLVYTLLAAVMRAWRDARTRLRLPEFSITELELQATAYLDGGFFRPHRDIGPHNTRRVTWVYYLHREPRAFDGGDLLLYDTDVARSHEPGAAASGSPLFERGLCTRLPPRDNQLVLFASEYFHEVTETACASPHFADCRFTLHGWLHAPREQATLEYLRSAEP